MFAKVNVMLSSKDLFARHCCVIINLESNKFNSPLIRIRQGREDKPPFYLGGGGGGLEGGGRENFSPL